MTKKKKINQEVISIKTYKTIESNLIKNRFGCFILSIYLYFFVLYSTVVFNWLNMNSLNIIYFIIGSLMIPSAILMYYGTKKF